MQILTIRKGFEIRIEIRKGFEAFEWKFELFERDSNHSKQIRTIRKGFEAFES